MGTTTSIYTKVLIFFALLVSTATAFAAAGTGESKRYHVFDVRRSLPMGPNEPVQRDYYINAGAQDGMKVGLVIPVFRRDPIHDIYGDITDDLIAPIAQLKLIYVQRTLSIGRYVAFAKGTARPIQDYANIMQGDRLDIGHARLEDEASEDGAKGEKGEEGKNSKPGKTGSAPSDVASQTTAASPDVKHTEPMQPAPPSTPPPIVKVPIEHNRNATQGGDGNVGQVTLKPLPDSQAPKQLDHKNGQTHSEEVDSSLSDDDDDEPVVLTQ